MAVVKVKGGAVDEVFRDVATEADARSKYPHLSGETLLEADEPPGTLWDGTSFSPPPESPAAPIDEPDSITAIKRLAAAVGVDISDLDL